MDAGKRPAQPAPDLRALILCFTLGVLIVHAQPALPPIWWFLPLLLSALPRWRFRAHWACLLFGAGLTVWQAQGLLAERWPDTRHGETLWVQGHVASLPEASGEAGQRTWRFRFDTDADDLPEHIRVSWYRSEQLLKAGECWNLRLRMRTPHGSLNPGGFDYEGWLFRQRIGAVATVKEAERCGEAENHQLLRWRQQLVDSLHHWLPGEASVPMLAALTVGDQSGLTDAEWEVFRRTGTSHLVAISGFNIAIIAGFAFFVCRWLWSLSPPLLLRLPAQKAGWIGSALAAVIYSGIAGFEPPVTRAMLMALVVVAAAFCNRLSQPSRVLALAWGAILLLDPLAITAPGLWLSFGAVAAIFYVMQGRLRPPRPLPAMIQLQLMLSLVLTPLTLYFFHGLSWPAPLVNLVAVPLFALLTPVLLVAMLLSGLVPALGLPLLRLCAQSVDLIGAALGWAAELPAAWIAWSPSPGALLLALFGALLLFAPRGLPLRPLALLCFLPLGWPPERAPREGFELTALDVGQGLSVVVRTPNHALLYDAGPAFDEGFDAGASVVVPYLLTQGVLRIDRLLLSHGDNDHAGGVSAVQRLIRVARQFGTPGHPPCEQGLRWRWDGVDFETLHPPEAGEGSDNNRSCVLRIAYGDRVALLSGDIERRAEERLLDAQPQRLRAEVLVSPHHGSRTSSTLAFVKAVQPRIVIHSAGWRSHFGHPRPEVVARYAEVGATQFVTGNLGAIRLQMDDRGWQAEPWRPRAARFWNAPAEWLAPLQK